MNIQEKKYELIKFEDGDFSLDVNVSPNEDTVWLTLEEIGLLFERDKSVIGKHAKNIIYNMELDENSVKANFAYTASDGKTYYVDHYNLDMILAIEYRVKSKRGILFRRWANSILKRYLLNGYVINNERIMAYQSNILQLEANVINIENRLGKMHSVTISSKTNYQLYELLILTYERICAIINMKIGDNISYV